MSLLFAPTGPVSFANPSSFISHTQTCTRNVSHISVSFSFKPNSNRRRYPLIINSCQDSDPSSHIPRSDFASFTHPLSSTLNEPNSVDDPVEPNLSEDTSYDSGAGSYVGGGGGDDANRRDDGGEGGSDDSDSSDQQLSALLKSENVTITQVPSDILSAYRSGFVGLSAISNFFAAQNNPFSRILMGCGDGMRNRFLADRLFLLKIIIEEGIGVFGKLSAEYEQRRSRFWKEQEFVFANLVTAILADFALVYLPAPSVALTAASKGGGIGAWLQRIGTQLPSNIFQTDRPFTMTQRAAGFALKASQLFFVGMLCCFTGVVLTNGLVFIREKLDKDYRPKTKKPNPVLVSLLYATFLGLSSGSRYQLVNGIESHIFPRIFAKTPKLAEEIATFALRYGNTFWGSQQWVMFCKFTNVQKTKDE